VVAVHCWHGVIARTRGVRIDAGTLAGKGEHTVS
jgi:hypothetical protein